MSWPARPGALPILGRHRWHHRPPRRRRISRSQVLGGEPEGSPPGLEEGCKGRGHCQGARRGPGGFPSGLRAGFEDCRSLRFFAGTMMLRWGIRRGASRLFLLCVVAEATSCAMGGRVPRRLWMARGEEGTLSALAAASVLPLEWYQHWDFDGFRWEHGLSVPRLSSEAQPTAAASGEGRAALRHVALRRPPLEL